MAKDRSEYMKAWREKKALEDPHYFKIKRVESQNRAKEDKRKYKSKRTMPDDEYEAYVAEYNRSYMREWRKRNPDYQKEYSARRRQQEIQHEQGIPALPQANSREVQTRGCVSSVAYVQCD